MQRKETNNSKKDIELNIDCYVLCPMLATFDTAHFETSLLNSDAPKNAVKIIHITKIHKEKNKIIRERLIIHEGPYKKGKKFKRN